MAMTPEQKAQIQEAILAIDSSAKAEQVQVADKLASLMATIDKVTAKAGVTVEDLLPGQLPTVEVSTPEDVSDDFASLLEDLAAAKKNVEAIFTDSSTAQPAAQPTTQPETSNSAAVDPAAVPVPTPDPTQAVIAPDGPVRITDPLAAPDQQPSV